MSTTRGERRRRRTRRAFGWIARGAALVAELVAKHHHEDDHVAWHASTAASSLNIAATELLEEGRR